MAISKGIIKNQILAKWRSAEMGEQDLDALIGVIVDAIVDEIKAHAEVTVTIVGGDCTYSGVHPALVSKSTGGIA